MNFIVNINDHEGCRDCFIINGMPGSRVFSQVDESASENQILLCNDSNAVKILMYWEVIVYCLVAIEGYMLKVDLTFYEILPIWRSYLPDKKPMR